MAQVLVTCGLGKSVLKQMTDRIEYCIMVMWIFCLLEYCIMMIWSFVCISSQGLTGNIVVYMIG